MVKLSVLYGHPTNADAFEKYYRDTHMPLASKMGVRIELAKVLGTPDGSKPAYYRTAEVYFDSMDHLQRVMASPAGQATASDLGNFATGGVTLFISEVV